MIKILFEYVDPEEVYYSTLLMSVLGGIIIFFLLLIFFLTRVREKEIDIDLDAKV